MRTEAEWIADRDALASRFPIGSLVETVPTCFGLEYGGGLAFVHNHEDGEDAGPVRGVVTGHTASRVEFADERDGGVWTMQPDSLRLVVPQ